MKIKTIDIETSPIVAMVWSLWKVNIGLNQIVRDWTVLSFSAKDLGDPEVRYLDVSEQEDYFDDYHIMATLREELDEADVVIWQNGTHFDRRKINARLIELGIEPPSPYKEIDTKVEAAKVAMFTSNKLEWLSDILTDTPKLKHNKFPGFELWTECLKGNPEAWAEMKEYNIRDTEATEELYLVLRPWMKQHPNVNVMDDEDETIKCTHCGSDHLQKRGYYYTNTGRYQKYQCQSCHAWSRGRFVNNTLAKRKSLLVGV